MIPAGYMAKRVYSTRTRSARPDSDFLKGTKVEDVYSVSGCISEYFTDYIQFWKHNGYWLFDTPEIIRDIAQERAIDLEGTQLFTMRSMSWSLTMTSTGGLGFARRACRRRRLRRNANSSKASML